MSIRGGGSRRPARAIDGGPHLRGAVLHRVVALGVLKERARAGALVGGDDGDALGQPARVEIADLIRVGAVDNHPMDRSHQHRRLSL